MTEKRIWVDADACPNVVKQIVCRAADRTHTRAYFVANRATALPPSQYTQSIVVSQGFDVADNYIVDQVNKNDLVITADIPLANDVIEKDALALNPRGELYTAATIKSRLTMRDFMDTMRSSGVNTGGPPPISQSERQSFANHLDRWLAQN